MWDQRIEYNTPGNLAACRKLASTALELASPREVRDLVSASKK
jgi:hypothetical protein